MGADITLRQMVASLAFLGSFLVVVFKFISSSSIQVIIEGEQISSHNLEGIYTFQEVLLLVVASILMGASILYLVLSVLRRDQGAMTGQGSEANAAEVVLEERKKAWESIALTLGEQEAMIYNLVLSSDGIMLQSDIVSSLNISKSTVSRILDLLESRGLIDRRRRGMGNVIMLR